MSNAPDPRGHIFDTTCLNYFALTNNLSLLDQRYHGQAYISREVLHELEDGVAGHPQLETVVAADWFEVLRLEETGDLLDFERLLLRWGKNERNRGEAATIILARRFDLVAVIDERIGRVTAKEQGLVITGTVGIIARMVLEGMLAEAECWAVLQEMISINPGGFRSPIKTRKQFTNLCRGSGR